MTLNPIKKPASTTLPPPLQEKKMLMVLRVKPHIRRAFLWWWNFCHLARLGDMQPVVRVCTQVYKSTKYKKKI